MKKILITFRQKVGLLTPLRNHFKYVLGELEKVQTTIPTTSRVVQLEKVQTASRQQQTVTSDR